MLNTDIKSFIRFNVLILPVDSSYVIGIVTRRGEHVTRD